MISQHHGSPILELRLARRSQASPTGRVRTDQINETDDAALVDPIGQLDDCPSTKRRARRRGDAIGGFTPGHTSCGVVVRRNPSGTCLREGDAQALRRRRMLSVMIMTADLADEPMAFAAAVLGTMTSPSISEMEMTARTSAGLLATTMAVSAGIHIGLTPEHLTEMPRLGQAFIVASLLGIAIAVALMLRPDDRRIAAIGGLFCLGQIIAWALIVTIRVPLFSGTPEPVEAIAILCKAVEAVGVGFAADLVRSQWTPRTRAMLALARDDLDKGSVGANPAKAEPDGQDVRGGD